MTVLWSLLALILPFSLAGLTKPVDLSHFYDENVLAWAGSTPFYISREDRSGVNEPWYAANEFGTAEHCGTHLDAPFHFNPTGWQVGQIPLEMFIAQGIVMDFRNVSAADPDYQVTAEDLQQWEKTHGPIPDGCIVLLDFGWAEKYKDKSEYFGSNKTDDFSTFHFPGLSECGAKWLAETGRIYGVGTDTASIDYGQSKNFESHRVLSASNMYMMEHIALPADPLPPRGFQLVALPMKIRHGTGGPCRVVALP